MHTKFILFIIAPSGPPLNLRVVQQQLTSITVSWQPPTASQQNGVITSYTIHITPPEGGSPYTLVTTGLSLTATSLIGNSPYSFAVAASTDAGTGPYTSPSLSIRTPPPGTTSIVHCMYCNACFKPSKLLLAVHISFTYSCNKCTTKCESAGS